MKWKKLGFFLQTTDPIVYILHYWILENTIEMKYEMKYDPMKYDEPAQQYKFLGAI